MLICGDCLDVLPTLEAESVDTCLADPPSGTAFMGKKWDSHSRYEARTDKGKRTQDALLTLDLEPWEAGFVAFTVDWASEVLRVLKPGASALVWALPRTSDLTVLGLRLAGFEIRDNFYHIFGQGFPKSADISKMIDRKNGKEREVIGTKVGLPGYREGEAAPHQIYGDGLTNGTLASAITAPATDAAKLWDGYGTGLKPAAEEWVWAMKPVDQGYVNNALKWGVSGLWIDGGRVGTGDKILCHGSTTTFDGNKGNYKNEGRKYRNDNNGRWPANVILSHTEGCRRVGEKRVGSGQPKRTVRPRGDSWRKLENREDRLGQVRALDNYGTETIADWECTDDCPVRQLGEQSGELVSNGGKGRHVISSTQAKNDNRVAYGDAAPVSGQVYGDRGSAARFFYQAKSSPRERHYGCDALYWRIDKDAPVGFVRISQAEWEQLPDEERAKGNIHPTIKPQELLNYLVRLTRTPTGGVVLDPFAGSCTTGMACIDEERDYILIEREREYCDIGEAKLAEKLKEAKQYDLPHLPR